ncbi:hypothetical protein [Acetobacter sp. P5B1]|uniref:hypothetical protein n=1 Tax=Acetobacter sp. P5B1 TaxID=2762620 RepID=UPI001C04B2D5|nr:hypothetical protein [Acetobacter sp. P5B1]
MSNFISRIKQKREQLSLMSDDEKKAHEDKRKLEIYTNSFNMNSAFLNNSLNKIIEQTHPAITPDMLDHEKQYKELFETDNPFTRELKKLGDDKKEVEAYLKEKLDFMLVKPTVISSGLFGADEERFLRVCNEIMTEFLNSFLIKNYQPYHDAMLSPYISKDLELRQQMHEALDICRNERMEMIQDFQNRPEAVEAREIQQKLMSLMADDSIKNNVISMHLDTNDLKDYLKNNIELDENGNIHIKKEASSLQLTR